MLVQYCADQLKLKLRAFLPLTLAPHCAELENNMGISEKTIAEFIIDQAQQARSNKEFTKVSCGLKDCRVVSPPQQVY